MNTAERLLLIIGLLVASVVLGGCSAIKLGYNNVDEVIYWWMDGYIDLTDDQTPRVRDEIARLHAWHRRAELPKVADLLQAMEQVAPADISPEQACAFVPMARDRLDAVATQAQAPAAWLASGLNAQQLAHLERKYERNNAAFRREWVQLNEQELNDKRAKQLLERAEMIYGQLDDPQRDMLRQQLGKTAFDARRVLAERQRRQRDILGTLRKVSSDGANPAEAGRMLKAMLERSLVPADPVFRDYQAKLLEEACRAFAAMHNSTSAAQRQAAVRRLRAYQRDLRDLSAQP